MDLHIILDIDQTLVDNMSMNEYENNKNKLRKPDFMKETMCIWTRPHLKEFIEFLDKNVKYISIWTNGSFSWLYYVLTTILSKYIPKKRFLLLLSIEYSIKQEIINNGMISMIPIKNIGEMIKRFPNNNISLYNTVLIDDNYHNCIFNRNNTIPIKKYYALEEIKGTRNNDLMFIIQIIIELKKSKNVQKTLNGVYDGIADYNKLFSIIQ
jgi:TFIIF-interacting CTD phosphatase-like protein